MTPTWTLPMTSWQTLLAHARMWHRVAAVEARAFVVCASERGGVPMVRVELHHDEEGRGCVEITARAGLAPHNAPAPATDLCAGTLAVVDGELVVRARQPLALMTVPLLDYLLLEIAGEATRLRRGATTAERAAA